MAFCLGTLVELLDQILHPEQYHQNWVLDSVKIPQIQLLLENASFLRDFLANSTPAIQARIETLEDRIRDAAENAEDILESFIKAHVLSNPVGQSLMIFPSDLTEVCQVFSSAAAEVIKINTTIGQSRKTTSAIHSRGDLSHSTPNHVLVGLDKSFTELRDRLTSRSSTVEIIPIIGMGELVWNDMRVCAPDNKNRSRIMLTTRENDVANYVSLRRHEMQLLSKEDSWELFERIVHVGEKCPSELEETAREIVRKCGGLPLALQVIGGFMSRAERTKDLWEKIAGDISSFITREDNQFSAIFSWSYANLPHYLKPCLLYIGAYPEDTEIQASGLIKLWLAEGILNPTIDRGREEVAKIYLNALIDRNLIFVHGRTFSRRVKYVGIHDLLRDLCLRKAEEKKFIFAKQLQEPVNALCLRCVCVTFSERTSDLSGCMDLMTHARSFQLINTGEWSLRFPTIGFELSLSLLKTLYLCAIIFHKFPIEILKLVNLKYLALRCGRGLDIESPESIGVLKNLQTIIFLVSDSFGGRRIEFPVGYLIFHNYDT